MDFGTFANIGVMVAMAVVGFVIRGLQKQIDEAKKEAVETARELNAYKLQVAKEYAPITYLKDVENRILLAIGEVKTSFNEFVKEYHGNRAGE